MEILIGVLVCLGILAAAAGALAFGLHYSLVQCRKTLLALAVFLGSACAYVLHFDPSFSTSLEVLTGGAFAVIGVFTAPQFSEQDFSKAITGTVGALFSVLQFIGVNNPDVETEVYTLIGLAVTAFSIWWVSNAGHRTALTRARR